jgi:lauroyl/myristoyl acyltransferase
MVAGIYGVRRPDGRRGWEAHIGEIIELPGESVPDAIALLTQRIARQLEYFIAQRPEEWHVFQPLWTADKETT